MSVQVRALLFLCLVGAGVHALSVYAGDDDSHDLYGSREVFTTEASEEDESQNRNTVHRISQFRQVTPNSETKTNNQPWSGKWTGQVRDEQGNTLSSVGVVVYSDYARGDDVVHISGTASDEGGEFSFSVAAQDVVSKAIVVVSKAGFLPLILPLRELDSRLPLNLVLNTGEQIHGRLVRGNEVVADHAVYLEISEGNYYFPGCVFLLSNERLLKKALRVVTDKNGDFVFSGLSATSYKILAWSDQEVNNALIEAEGVDDPFSRREILDKNAFVFDVEFPTQAPQDNLVVDIERTKVNLRIDAQGIVPRGLVVKITEYKNQVTKEQTFFHQDVIALFLERGGTYDIEVSLAGFQSWKSSIVASKGLFVDEQVVTLIPDQRRRLILQIPEAARLNLSEVRIRLEKSAEIPPRPKKFTSRNEKLAYENECMAIRLRFLTNLHRSIQTSSSCSWGSGPPADPEPGQYLVMKRAQGDEYMSLLPANFLGCYSLDIDSKLECHKGAYLWLKAHHVRLPKCGDSVHLRIDPVQGSRVDLVLDEDKNGSSRTVRLYSIDVKKRFYSDDHVSNVKSFQGRLLTVERFWAIPSGEYEIRRGDDDQKVLSRIKVMPGQYLKFRVPRDDAE